MQTNRVLDNTIMGRQRARRARLHPLSARLYFRRNPGRTLPVAFVIVVAVALVASVVSLVDSIDMTVLTMYGYQKHFSVVTPRNALAVSEDIKAGIRKEPLLGAVFTTRPAFTVVRTIFGKMPFVVFGIPPVAWGEAMRRCGLRMVSGRMPEDGKPEVALHADIARNRHLKLGDVVLEPNSEDSYSIIPVRLVGTFDGPVWLAITSEAFIRNHFPVAPQGLILMAKNDDRQADLDRALDRRMDKAHARLWTYANLVRDTRDALASLYLIMNVVIGIVIFAIAFLTGMLANIYFMQRLPEFATLSAIGYLRRDLLRRVLGETALLCAVGWALGSVLTAGVLLGIKAWIMTPRGMILDPFDVAAYRYTIPLPLTIAAFALLPIARRLRRLDPVSIIERRQ
jgi:ABC-type lipoprotein release transport system permease subunit